MPKYLEKASDKEKARFEALKNFSPILFQAMESRPDYWPLVLADNLSDYKSFFNFADAQYFEEFLLKQSHEKDFLNTLRLSKTLIFAWLAARDLTNEINLQRCCYVLSALADAALKASIKWLELDFTKRNEELSFIPTVFSLGKLGGMELNYSSDIDLVYLYQKKNNYVEHSAQIKKFFSKLTGAIADLNAFGMLFRVDLDLRPKGKDGAMAQEFTQALNHFLHSGQPWERLAWIKARVSAGDKMAGEKFLNDLAPFIFRKHLDYVAIEELSLVKEQIDAVRINNPSLQNNVKLGNGGIRDIEFLTQSLILMHGGRHLALKGQGTLQALSMIGAENIISAEKAALLAESYIFLRKTEHRLQLKYLRQTQSLPLKDDEQTLLALSMGFNNYNSFLKQLNFWRDFNQEELRRLLNRVVPKIKDSKQQIKDLPKFLKPDFDLKERNKNLLELGFENIERDSKNLETLFNASYLPKPLIRYRKQAELLAPKLFQAVLKSAKPGLALNNLTAFLNSIGPKSGYLNMLAENPDLISPLIISLGCSGFLSELLIRHPALLESQLLNLNEQISIKESIENFWLNFSLESDWESRLALSRKFKNETLLKLALANLKGEIKLNDLSLYLSEIAEVTVSSGLLLSAEQVSGKRYEKTSQLPLMVAYLGKLGGCELSYSSDLDLLFFVTENSESQGIKIAQRLFSFLTLNHLEGPGYQVDARLRPNGGSGPLAVTWRSFQIYHQNSPLWERQALLKFRAGEGNLKLIADSKKIIEEILWKKNLPISAKQEIYTMFQRLSQERAKIPEHKLGLKFGEGSISAAEFIIQYLLLKFGAKNPRIRSTNSLKALFEMIECKLIDSDFSKLYNAYEKLLAISGYLALTAGRYSGKYIYSVKDVEELSLLMNEDFKLEIVNCKKIITHFYELVFLTNIY